MDQFPQMLYKVGGPEQIHGGQFSTIIVQDEDARDVAMSDGWHETTPAAVEAAAAAKLAETEPPAPAGPPTRAELEQKAADLGLKFDGRTGDKKLSDAIAFKLAESAGA